MSTFKATLISTLKNGFFKQKKLLNINWRKSEIINLFIKVEKNNSDGYNL